MGSQPPVKGPRRRRHCLNCDELFVPRVKQQKFCRKNPDKPTMCHDEWHRAGGVSFGKFKAIVVAEVAKAERRIYTEVREMLRKAGVTREVRDRLKPPPHVEMLDGVPLQPAGR